MEKPLTVEEVCNILLCGFGDFYVADILSEKLCRPRYCYSKHELMFAAKLGFCFKDKSDATTKAHQILANVINKED